MTVLEKKMYEILGVISAGNAPIVFVGGLITKLILAEKGFTGVDRPTVDIDGYWVGTPPTMEYLVETINQSLKAFKGALFAEGTREYGKGITAGISIMEAATGRRVISMDVDVRPAGESKIYYYDGIAIRGVLPSEILADKIFVLSSQHLFRRAKDLLDIYSLAHCVCARTDEIYAALKRKDRVFGGFKEFQTRREDIRHAYGRLAGIEGKPDFDALYSYLLKFSAPFISDEKSPMVWNMDLSKWEKVRP
jgi:hypothetical protein